MSGRRLGLGYRYRCDSQRDTREEIARTAETVIRVKKKTRCTKGRGRGRGVMSEGRVIIRWRSENREETYRDLNEPLG